MPNKDDRIPIQKLDFSSKKQRALFVSLLVFTPIALLLGWWAIVHFFSFIIVMIIVSVICLIVFMFYIAPIVLEWIQSGDWEWDWWG